MPPELLDAQAETSSASDTENLTDGVTTGDGGAGSPTANTETDDDAQLDFDAIFASVLDGEEAAEEEEPGSQPEDENAELEGVKPEGEGEKTEDDSKLPFHQHPRFQAVIRERNEAREKAKEVETYKDDAEAFRGLTSRIDAAGVDPEQFSGLIKAAVLSQDDPTAAYEAAKPFIRTLMLNAGLLLPEAQRKAVESGEMTRERASELARANAQIEASKRQREAQDRAERERQASQANVAQEQRAEAWINKMRSSDPKFDDKSQWVVAETLRIQQLEGEAKTPDQLEAQLNRAYEAVRKSFAPAAPAKRHQPLPAGKGSNGTARPKHVTEDGEVDMLSVINSVLD